MKVQYKVYIGNTTFESEVDEVPDDIRKELQDDIIRIRLLTFANKKSTELYSSQYHVVIGEPIKQPWEDKTLNLEQKSKVYSIEMHRITGCTYGSESYEKHLQMVVDEGKKYIHLIDIEVRHIAMACLWAHDVIEDTRQTYNDVKKVLIEAVADVVYNVTNELGKNRKERAMKTYPKIFNKYLETFTKLCDRLANTKASKANGHRMFKVYQAEYAEFRKALYIPGSDFEDMWIELDEVNKD